MEGGRKVPVDIWEECPSSGSLYREGSGVESTGIQTTTPLIVT